MNLVVVGSTTDGLGKLDPDPTLGPDLLEDEARILDRRSRLPDDPAEEVLAAVEWRHHLEDR